jgi:hypothetical protein
LQVRCRSTDQADQQGQTIRSGSTIHRRSTSLANKYVYAPEHLPGHCSKSQSLSTGCAYTYKGRCQKIRCGLCI